MYIDDTRSLEDVIPVLAAAPVLALDTEFMRERTYYARLCLVQVATPADVFVIDAIKLADDLSLLMPVLAAPAMKVLHAGAQDVEILLRATGVAPAPVFDTQVAATLAGFPTQVGYAQLVKEMTGIVIDKADTFTDWTARPLSAAQLAYAEEDVRHLPGIYLTLRDRLGREGRLEWLAEDFERLADPATYEVDPLAQYLRVKRASTLDRRSLGVLREIAAWRETEAQRADIPKRWLIADESLVEIARRRPGSAAELSAIRGVNERVLSRAASGLLAAVARGETVPDTELPKLPKRDRVSKDAQPIADLLSAVLKVRAREHGVASSLFATRDEIEGFAAGDHAGNPLTSGWRHSLAGAELEAIMEGRVGVSVVDGRITLRPTGGDAHDDG